ncbi:transposase [Aliiglaciecola sp. 3_MG-2023]|uniref:transposase n=1 Tax=Aliiglaciecola sp. 3_MG-2023 TaxID=3062644 RepID=UPI0026E1E56E|nr:transposase [Aliiglaciecola sp. 3_MG-2023]MDO6695475.1 transposase [Aliiglaciecola sp. 3_MG-2023]
MPQPRKHQICLADTPYYHCVSRCVRRAFLCGEDKYSGKNYEHRRQWVEDRLLLLASAFCIDVCAYAVMSNHVHVVLHVFKDQALTLSDFEVFERWQKIHRPTELVQQFYTLENSDNFSDLQLETIANTISIYRKRLYDISWFMRELNEPIARQANQEDDCKGHFWEGRFKSQALLDEKALAACMVYVDLNPMRAKVASSPETSDYTSIKRRMSAFRHGYQPPSLMPFKYRSSKHQEIELPYSLKDYLKLIHFSAQRFVSLNKSKTAPPSILKTLVTNEQSWLELTYNFEDVFGVVAGESVTMECFRRNTGRTKLKGAKAITP